VIGDVSLKDLRLRMDEHLMAVEEVLGGLDLYVQQLDSRVTRVERLLGIEPEGLALNGALADFQRLSVLVERLRGELK